MTDTHELTLLHELPLLRSRSESTSVNRGIYCPIPLRPVTFTEINTSILDFKTECKVYLPCKSKSVNFIEFPSSHSRIEKTNSIVNMKKKDDNLEMEKFFGRESNSTRATNTTDAFDSISEEGEEEHNPFDEIGFSPERVPSRASNPLVQDDKFLEVEDYLDKLCKFNARCCNVKGHSGSSGLSSTHAV